jgi:hypothetical protein
MNGVSKTACSENKSDTLASVMHEDRVTTECHVRIHAMGAGCMTEFNYAENGMTCEALCSIW